MTQARGMGLFYERVDTFLGLLALVAYIICIVALAAAVTWLVVRLSPSPEQRRAKEAAKQTPAA